MAYPSLGQYTVMRVGNQVSFDLAKDESPQYTDIVGNTQYPSFYVAYDELNVYFRIRLNEDPRNTQKTGLRNSSWGVLVSTDGSRESYEWLISASGRTNRINLIKNTVKQVNSWSDAAEGTGNGNPNAIIPIINFDYVRVMPVQDNSLFSNDPDFFMDIIIPAQLFFTELGINDQTPLQFIPFTSANDNVYNKDSLRRDENYEFRDAFTDPVTLMDVDVKADLSLVKNILTRPQVIFTGQMYEYTEKITVTNTGRSTATAVTVINQFGFDIIANAEILSFSAGTAIYNPISKIISWNVGNLPAGTSAVLEIKTSGRFDYSDNGSRVLQTATANGFDNFTGNRLETIVVFDEIAVIASGGVSGTVRNESTGVAVANAVVQLVSEDGTVIAEDTTDAFGNFSIVPVPPGSYTLRISAEEFAPYSNTVTVTPGETTVLNITIDPVPAVLSGSVRDTSGNPVTGASVTLYDSFGVQEVRSVTNENGNYQISNIPPGTYSVIVVADGFQSSSFPVTLDNGEAEQASVVLRALPASVSGQVRSASGLPLAGAEVEAVNEAGQIVTSAITDESGNYQISSLSAGFYFIRLRAPNFQQQQIGVRLASGENETVNVSLQPSPGAIEGTVTDDETGEPLDDADVRVVNAQNVVVSTIVTNEEGIFTTPSLPPGSYTLTIREEGFAAKTVGVIVENGQTVTFSVALERLAGSLAGTVADSSGASISEAQVDLLLNNTVIASVETNSEGRFVINGLTPNAYTVNARAAGFVTQTLGAAVLPDQVTPLLFQLEEQPARLSGSIINTDGFPLQGSIINLYQNSISGALVETTVSSPDGTFSFNNLRSGSYAITISLENYQTTLDAVIVNRGQTTIQSYTLRPQPARIEGIVYEVEDGSSVPEPLASVSVFLRIVDLNGPSVGNVLTDENGRFLFDQLQPGAYSLVFEQIDHQTASANVLLDPGETETINVTLVHEPGILAGFIFDEETGSPLAGATVIITDQLSITWATSITDNQGVFVAATLPPGNYTVNAFYNTYQNGFNGAIVYSNVVTTVNVGLQPNPGAITGTILPPNEATIVQLFNTENIFIDTVSTNTQGLFEFRNLAPGMYKVIAQTPGYEIAETGAIVAADAETVINLTLIPNPAEIRGRVLNEENEPLQSAIVQILDINNNIFGSGGVDENGSFVIGLLPPGNYTLLAGAPNYSGSVTGVYLDPGEAETGIVIILAPNPGEISGLVVDATNNLAVEAAIVELRDEDGVSAASITTNASGNFVLSGIYPGSYTVIVSKAGYATEITGTIIRPNTASSANVALSPLPGIIEGVVTDLSGNPITENSIEVQLIDENILLKAILAESEGKFIFTGVRPGVYFVNALAPGYVATTISVLVNAEQTTEAIIPLPPEPASIHGVVTNGATGELLPNVFLEIDDFNGIVLTSAISGREGEYILKNLPPGDLEVHVTASGFGAVTLTVQTLPGGIEHVNIALVPNFGTALGFVTDADTALPILGAIIEIDDQAGNHVTTSLSDNRGLYEILGLSPGLYVVTVHAPGYRNDAANIRIASDTATRLSFTLKSTPSVLQGTIISDETGLPLQDSTVFLRVLTPVGPVVTTAVTTIEGFYQFTEVNPDTYTLVVTKFNYGSQSATVTLDPGEVRDVTFSLKKLSAEVEGDVTNVITDEALPETTVALLTNSGVLIRTTQTNQNGYYVFDGFNAGSYILGAIRPLFERKQIAFEVDPGEVERVDFELQPLPGSVVGTINDSETNSPLVGAVVQFYVPESTTPVSRTLTDGVGIFRETGLEPGQYTVTATSLNYNTAKTGVTVNPGDVTSTTILLSPFPGRVSGNVTSSEGEPIADANIKIVDPSSIVLNGVSNVDGSFNFGNVPSGQLTIIVSAPNFSSSTKGVLVSPGAVIQNILFRLVPDDGKIAGVLVNEEGEGISGAVVTVTSPSGIPITSTVTNGAGRFETFGLLPGPYTVTGVARDFTNTSIGAFVRSNEVTVIDLLLPREFGKIEGTVLDFDEEHPLGNNIIVKVYSKTGVLLQSLLANSNGDFEVPAQAPGEYVVLASAPGHTSEELAIAVQPAQITALQIYVFANPASLAGQVIDVDTGKSIPGVRIIVTGENSLILSSTTTNEDGSFYIENLPGHNVNVTARIFGYGSRSVGVFLEHGEASFTLLELKRETGTLTGQLITEEGKGVKGSLKVIDRTEAVLINMLTDNEGRFELPNLIPASYTLQAASEGFNERNIGAIIEPGVFTDILIVLSADNIALLSGRVTNSENGEPLSNAVIEARQNSMSGPVNATTISDVDGRYSFNGLLAGTLYALTAKLENFSQQSKVLVLDSVEENIVNFNLQPASTVLSGRVADEAGNGLPDTLIRIITEQGTVVSELQTEFEGRFKVTGLAPGTYTLVGVNQLYGNASVPFSLTTGERKFIELVLVNLAGSIAGKVADAFTGQGIAGAVVEAYRDLTPIENTVTDPDGNYILEGLNAEEMTFTATASGYTTQTTKFTVISGDTQQLDFFLAKNPASISGFVQSETGEPIGGASIRIFDSQGRLVTSAVSQADKRGAFGFTSLPAGSFRFLVSAPGFPDVSAEFFLSEGEDITNFIIVLNAQPEPGQTAISGMVVDENNQPLSNVLVTVYVKEEVAAITLTGENGKFEVTNIEPGTVTIILSADGYIDGLLVIELSAGEQVTGLVVQLQKEDQPAGNLTGQVVDENSDPVEGALVTISAIDELETFSVSAAAENDVVRIEVTDSSGRFETESLAIGEYLITAEKEGYQSGELEVFISEDDTIDVILSITQITPPVPPVPPVPPIPPVPDNGNGTSIITGRLISNSALFLVSQGTGRPIYLGGLTFPTEFMFSKEDPNTGLAVFIYEDLSAAGEVIARVYAADLSQLSIVYINRN